MQRKHINTDWETSKLPKPPKKIRVKGIRGLLGVTSPSKTLYYAATGDKEVLKHLGIARKYMNYRRLTTKAQWKGFYSNLRWKRRVERSKNECTEI